MYKNGEYWTPKDWTINNTIEISCTALFFIIAIVIWIVR